MASQITNYKCPACTGPLQYVGASGMLECEYCGSSYGISEIEELYAGKIQQAEAAAAAAAVAEQEQEEDEEYQMPEGSEEDWDGSGISDDWGAEAEGMKAYNCPSCGAELIFDASTAATSCPYCGNPTIIPGSFAGTLKPDYIIPFKLDKMQAINALARYYRGKKLLPKAFAESNHLDEIKGVYVPFWLYDGMVYADAAYNATRVSSRISGNVRITTTSHFNVRRAGQMGFNKIPVDGSSKMPDAHMDAIEPYDYDGLKPFSTAYMPGFMAERYDTGSEDCARRADERAKQTMLDRIRASVSGYSSVTPMRQDVQLRRGKVYYALMPVWLLHTKWNEQHFLFAMNGQTGKLIGDLPVDRKKYFAYFAGIAAPIMAVLAALLLF